MRKETALVMEVPVAFRPKLSACAAVVKVGEMRAPLKAMVPVVLVRTTLVPVVTAPVKVAPPELVMVRVDKLAVPMIPLTAIVPAVFKVMDWVLAVVPFTLVKLMAPLAVLVSVVLAPKVTAPL